MQEPKFIKNSSWKYLSEGLFCAILFRVCWRSVTAVANEFILVEQGGEWPSVVGTSISGPWAQHDPWQADSGESKKEIFYYMHFPTPQS